MSFITLSVQCDEEKRELLLAELSLFPFSAFEEKEDGLLAACEEEEWTEEAAIKSILDRYKVPFVIDRVEKVNWNEEWEKHYDPVIVGDQCLVRATFHPPMPEYPYEIIITPKMSFGTGHHATTWQILNYQLGLDHEGKQVLDVGCGTGALAIMAKKRGAQKVAAVDIDEWCVENSRENFALNDCEDIWLRLGGIEVVPEDLTFDVVLANINKNVLLEQMNQYKEHMKEQSQLVISGFYSSDMPDLIRKANELGLNYVTQSSKDNWAMLVVERK